jgi:hypothetical protein
MTKGLNSIFWDEKKCVLIPINQKIVEIIIKNKT